MSKQIIILILVLYHSFNINSYCQTKHISCNNNRYTSDVFTNITITRNILYGNNTTIGGTNVNLFMDIFSPTDDTTTLRPAIVLAFGGSFISGSRNDLEELCLFYSKKGFVVATIDYRLYDSILNPLPEESIIVDQIFKGVSDMKAAIRFLKEDAATLNIYKIDPQNIFIGGTSAGAIIANHTAYIDSDDTLPPAIELAITNNGGIEGNSSTNTQYNSKIRGVINFSGAILDSNLIDDNDPILFSAHESGDTVVPFNNGFLTFNGNNVIESDGSNIMHTRANTVFLDNYLVTINSSNHLDYIEPIENSNNVLKESTTFLKNFLCPKTLHVLTNKNTELIKIHPNPTKGVVNISGYNSSNIILKIFNIYGKELYHKTISNPIKDKINLNLQPGVYFIHLRDFKNRNFRSFKIVKQ